jgi:protease-4
LGYRFDPGNRRLLEYRALAGSRVLFLESIAMRDVPARIGMGCLATLLVSMVSGCSAPSFLVTPVSSSQTLNEEVVQEERGFGAGKIAIIEVEGMLANARVGGLLQAGENKLSLFTQELEKAETDPDVKAIVLRVNSPGGTVTTSDTMYQQIKRFKAHTHKPVIACTQEVTASGAYYVCCAADRIVAHPTSVVGSIGVIFSNFDATDGLAKLGIQSRAVHSGTLKEMGSPFKHETPLEQRVMQEMVNEYYIRFTSVVKSNRPNVQETPPPPPAKDPSDYAGVFSGRVWSGAKAVELGLADQLGLLDDAIDVARSAARAPRAKAVLYKRPYGYSGSIYAETETPRPQANVIQLNLPGAQSILPTGFYYLWQP